MSVSWKGAYGAIVNEAARRGIFELPPRYASGQALGIIAVDLDYPKVPGNVVNATTYDFPVLYEMVSFEIEQLFASGKLFRDEISSHIGSQQHSGYDRRIKRKRIHDLHDRFCVILYESHSSARHSNHRDTHGPHGKQSLIEGFGQPEPASRHLVQHTDCSKYQHYGRKNVHYRKSPVLSRSSFSV